MDPWTSGSGLSGGRGLVFQLHFPCNRGYRDPLVFRSLKFTKMTTHVYPIHRAIGRPVVCKGLKGLYIILAALSLITDLLLFVILYISGVTPWLCIVLAVGLGGTALAMIARLNHRYGPYGLQQRMAAKRLPRTIRITCRREFINLKNNKNHVQDKEGIAAGDGILRACPHQ
jgi:hypothetical protein